MVSIYVFFSVLVFDYYLFIPLYLKVCFRQLLLKWCFANRCFEIEDTDREHRKLRKLDACQNKTTLSI